MKTESSRHDFFLFQGLNPVFALGKLATPQSFCEDLRNGTPLPSYISGSFSEQQVYPQIVSRHLIAVSNGPSLKAQTLLSITTTLCVWVRFIQTPNSKTATTRCLYCMRQGKRLMCMSSMAVCSCVKGGNSTDFFCRL